MNTQDYKLLLNDLPEEPGVYRFIDKKDTIIYVGKAKNLKKRIGSYFGEKKHQYQKTRIMVRTALRLEWTVVETEHDALLLENTLIKNIQPRYNVTFRDDKTYTYLCIKNEKFPRVFFTRRVIRDGSHYFGPFTSKYRTNIVFDIVKKLFQLRTCALPLTAANIQKGKFKVCLEYHIKNCTGPCVGFESEDSYQKKIESIKYILNGQLKPVKEYLLQEMQGASERLDFELAQNLKDKLTAFDSYQGKSTVVSTSIQDVDVFTIGYHERNAYVSYLKIVHGTMLHTHIQELELNCDDDEEEILIYAIERLRNRFNSVAPELILLREISYPDATVTITVPQRGEKKDLLDMSKKNLDYYMAQKSRDAATRAMKVNSAERIMTTLRDVLQMKELPIHIECFDNSNIQGTNPVSSCVVFKNGVPSKADYRHFKVRDSDGQPDDFAHMAQVVHRRYSRLMEEGGVLPQLIIIDGGKGQLNAAMESLDQLGLKGHITIIGIAKKLEEIFFPGDPYPLYINKKSEALKLIQQCRDEAHRFAINFHRLQRSKNLLKLQLTELPGVGEKTAQKLLAHFGSMQSMMEAGKAGWIEVVGEVVAERIEKYFQAEE